MKAKNNYIEQFKELLVENNDAKILNFVKSDFINYLSTLEKEYDNLLKESRKRDKKYSELYKEVEHMKQNYIL